jgi:hypothetical protein
MGRQYSMLSAKTGVIFGESVKAIQNSHDTVAGLRIITQYFRCEGNLS